jgi:hypothetical protein
MRSLNSSAKAHDSTRPPGSRSYSDARHTIILVRPAHDRTWPPGTWSNLVARLTIVLGRPRTRSYSAAQCMIVLGRPHTRSYSASPIRNFLDTTCSRIFRKGDQRCREITTRIRESRGRTPGPPTREYQIRVFRLTEEFKRIKLNNNH